MDEYKMMCLLYDMAVKQDEEISRQEDAIKELNKEIDEVMQIIQNPGD